jgi:hypothetical protein
MDDDVTKQGRRLDVLGAEGKLLMKDADGAIRASKRSSDFHTQMERNPSNADNEVKYLERDLKGEYYKTDRYSKRGPEPATDVVPRAKGGPVKKGGALWNGQLLMFG